MDWIGIGSGKWTHVQIWYVSHNHLVNLTALCKRNHTRPKVYCQNFRGRIPNFRGIPPEPYLE